MKKYICPQFKRCQWADVCYHAKQHKKFTCDNVCQKQFIISRGRKPKPTPCLDLDKLPLKKQIELFY